MAQPGATSLMVATGQGQNEEPPVFRRTPAADKRCGNLIRHAPYGNPPQYDFMR
jgi:hypothetical protein